MAKIKLDEDGWTLESEAESWVLYRAVMRTRKTDAKDGKSWKAGDEYEGTTGHTCHPTVAMALERYGEARLRLSDAVSLDELVRVQEATREIIHRLGLGEAA